MKTSATCICSNAVWGCYPFVESIKSFLPAFDEVLVVYNPYGIDDTETILEKEFGKQIRMVPAYFDLDDVSVSWLSYGIARTTGYQACTGDIVAVFDIDGILHERDIDEVKKLCAEMYRKKTPAAYWMKNRIYGLNLAYSQGKHGTIANKAVVGDNVHWYFTNKKGIATWKKGFEIGKQTQWGVRLFGYEHLWDTREVVIKKALRYERMIDRAYNRPHRPDEEVIADYMQAFKNSEKPKIHLSIQDHPKIIQDKLKSLNPSHFGYNWFGQ